MDAKKYNRIKLWLEISGGVLFFILLLLIVLTDFSKSLENWLASFVNSDYLRFILFVIILSVLISVLTSPLNFYSGFILEHKYHLSNQTFGQYLIDKLKSLIVSLLIGIPILLLFYYLLKNYPDNWWLFFSVAMFFISVVLAQIFPILIFPLFFKLKPIEDTQLVNEIKELADSNNFKFSKIYSFDLSSKTKKANAALTGLGKTKKIILGDTLLNLLTLDEIKTVLAHEIGHYKLKHIQKNLLWGTIQSFLIFYLIDKLYKNSLSLFGFNSIDQISAFPILIIWGFLIGIIVTPLSNYLSRKYEYEADEFAVKSTALPVAFKSALTKLFEKNLADKEPHPFVEWYFYSHPSFHRRLKNIDTLMNYF
jgi:STE24 endopeptidase